MKILKTLAYYKCTSTGTQSFNATSIINLSKGDSIHATIAGASSDVLQNQANLTFLSVAEL